MKKIHQATSSVKFEGTDPGTSSKQTCKWCVSVQNSPPQPSDIKSQLQKINKFENINKESDHCEK